jgi:hypothetical protein
MNKVWILAFLTALAPAALAQSRIVKPYESSSKFESKSAIDAAVLAGLRKRGLPPANRCSDEVFVRRVYLDLIGALPKPEEVLVFLRDRRPDKRSALIRDLLERNEFADYWSLRWCDLLRVKAEFPINLWPNAVQAYHRWVHDAIRENRPYDRFARELLTASGSNFRVPAVNFCRAVSSQEPAALAQAAALTFMGARFEAWPQARRDGMAAFFSRVAFKRTLEWKEEIVHLSPAPAEPIDAVFPDGTKVRIPPDRDPRQVFADWLIRSENPWFAKTVANRVWAWLMGRGVIHEPDDIRPDNPPSNPELLSCLERELVMSNYDLRYLIRVILESSTYQQSSIPKSRRPEADALFARYIPRRLEAEVLIDALCWITGSSERYSSAIPEPFTFVPEDNRSITLADGSITSPFLEMFGRPARDTGLWSERNNSPTGGQRLHLLNSSDIQTRIERSPRLARLAVEGRRDPRKILQGVFLLILSRPATPQEIRTIEQYARAGGRNPKLAFEDVVWALINSKEFLYRH